ncbi:MAG: FAD-binding protein [Clostridia bacterium]|nr:FAD-binding protein [Clostridia bacterium]MBQ6373759.1 FAD-binding protein [Clostridia bacterium]
MKRLMALVLAFVMLMTLQLAFAETTITKTETGFGGDVTVTVTFDGDRIVAVEATGDQETQGVGSRAIELLPDQIVAAQSADIDVVTGASMTSTALLSAAKVAIDENIGAEAAEATLAMTPGTYTAKAAGFGGNVAATVTVTEDAIESITLENEQVDNPFINYEVWTYVYPLSCTIEAPQIFETVTDRLVPRVIEQQNLNVDVITGATATSTAAKLAIRDCIKQAGGDAAITALTKEQPVSDEKLTYDADVVVVGGGTSGTTAAARLASKGAKVVLIEKSGRLGGEGSLSSGFMCFGSAHQNEEGMDTNAAKMATFEKWMTATHYGSRAVIVREFMDNNGETADFLVDNGIPFRFSESGANYAVESVYNMDVAQGFKNLGQLVIDAGGEILFETTGKELIMKDGKPAGIRAERYDGAEITVNAGTVIMATGGFGANPEMTREYIGDTFSQFSVKNTGDGIRMLLDAGAVMYHPTAVNSHILNTIGNPAGFEIFDQTIPFEILISYPVLKVNEYGERVAREDIGAVGSMQALNNYYTAQSGNFFTVFSQEMADIMKESGLAGLGQTARSFVVEFENVAFDSSLPMENIQAVLDACVEQGLAYKADTVAELAEQMGVPVQALVETVADYNALCDLGEDLTFGKESAYMHSLGEEGPFYAIIGKTDIYGTLGGVDVNKHTQVLDADHNVIDGLYAVGLDSIGVVFDGGGYNEQGGMTLGWGFTSGKIAADHIAAGMGLTE